MPSDRGRKITDEDVRHIYLGLFAAAVKQLKDRKLAVSHGEDSLYEELYLALKNWQRDRTAQLRARTPQQIVAVALAINARRKAVRDAE
jgi:hypothetical protein